MFAQTLNKIFQIKQSLWLLPYQIRSKRKIAAHLRENADCVRVNIGSGPTPLAGWLNGEPWPSKETVCIDAYKRLPFKDSSVQFINCEHLVEHLGYKECQYFFKECFRALRNGGVLRISTPSLERLIQLYLGNGRLQTRELLAHHRKYHNSTVESTCEWFNDHMQLWGHKFIFDEPTSVELLRKAGFSRTIRCEYGKSEHPELQGIDKHFKGVEWLKWPYVMIFEAYK